MNMIIKIIKYISNKDYRFLINAAHGLYNSMPDEEYLKRKYKAAMGIRLNLKNPKTFNEKLQWLKLYDRKPEYTIMVNKYEVKQYVADIIGEEHIIPTLGVWDNFDDIDFSKLPNQFVLKCTHDSGSVVVCKSKNELNFDAVKKKLEKSLKRNYYYAGREWPYKNVKPRIIAEKYVEEYEAPNADLIDYKWFCFNGEVKMLYVSQGLSNHATAKISFYDINYQKMPFKRTDYEDFDVDPPKPKTWHEQIEIAKLLSRNYPFIRIDLYEVNSCVYFSEITFSPCAGFLPFDPIKWDNILGKWIELPIEENYL